VNNLDKDYDVTGKLLEGNLWVFTLICIPNFVGTFETERHYCALIHLLLIVSLYSDLYSAVLLQ